MSTERYNARDAEARWQKAWDGARHLQHPRNDDPSRNTTCSRCSPIRRGASTWATSRNYTMGDVWPATSAPGASTCCIRWAGTRSACRPRTPPWSARPHPAKWTYDNIDAMKGQLKSMGLSLDWSARDRDLHPELLQASAADCSSTCCKQGLAYRKSVQGQLGPRRS